MERAESQCADSAGTAGVFSCLLYAADYLYVKYKEYKQPLGFDISHVYKVWLGVVPETSADYDTTACTRRMEWMISSQS